MRQYEMYELAFTGREPEGSRAIVDLKAEFICDGKTVTTKGFYAGKGIYKVRFYPSRAGHYSWKVTGAIPAEGQEICEACEEGEPEGMDAADRRHPADADTDAARSRDWVHGMVKANGLHFQYEDGTWYYPFGTTVYALVHQEKELVDTTMKTLQAAFFNKIRFCVFPKYYDFNHNDPEFFPFERKGEGWDVHRPVYAYWDGLEARIRELGQMGIQGDLILFHPYDRWGFARLTREESLVYLDYLLRRLSAVPNLWWSLANEYDLMPNYNGEDWEAFAGFVAANDPYDHCLSNHNCMAYWDFGRKEVTHCCIQDVNVNEVPELQEKYGKPVVFDECRYEGNIIHSWGNLSGRELVRRFWTAVCCGGYCTHGETFYSDDQVLWWAKGGVLKGESPARIAFLREIAESLPGPITFLGEETGAMTAGQLTAMKENGASEELYQNPFTRAMLNLPRERMLSMVSKGRVAVGHCGREAFIKFLERQCAALTEMNLPEDGRYRIEVIDTWEMTRKVVMRNGNGRIQVALPGKEDMAVLAVRETGCWMIHADSPMKTFLKKV